MIFSVAALEIVSEATDLAGMLSGTAACFSPHISVYPRFEATEEQLEQLKFSLMNMFVPSMIRLRGPKVIGENLTWYECETSSIGYENLVNSHNVILKISMNAGFSCDPMFSGKNYRPHFTTRSNLSAEISKEETAIFVRGLRYVLYNIDGLSGVVTTNALV